MGQKNMIMIVDDNPLDQMITAQVLRNTYGQEQIMVMESAAKALAYLRENQHDPEAMPALIILDLDMPEINGFGFLKQFSELAEQIKNTCKIVVLTASEQLEDLQMMQTDPRVAKLIPKPLRKNSLVPVI
ncbi:MAG: response regulator [Pedobacter sp.]|nr:response regulator [Pedobacter sp.]MDQ8051427.1 response regulator [Pedobacter sp.]